MMRFAFNTRNMLVAVVLTAGYVAVIPNTPNTPARADVGMSGLIDTQIAAAEVPETPLLASVAVTVAGAVETTSTAPASPSTTEEPPPTVPLTIRERALLKMVDLGLPGWVVRGFDCVGRHESAWVSKRSDNQNYDGSYDHGPLQFNDKAHGARMRALGLDPYVAEDAATFAATLWWEQGFGPWAATRSLCGV